MTVMQLGYIPSADAMLEYVAVHRAAEAVQALQRARETAEIPGFWDEECFSRLPVGFSCARRRGSLGYGGCLGGGTRARLHGAAAPRDPEYLD